MTTRTLLLLLLLLLRSSSSFQVGHYPWYATYNVLSANLPLAPPDSTLLKLARNAFLGDDDDDDNNNNKRRSSSGTTATSALKKGKEANNPLVVGVTQVFAPPRYQTVVPIVSESSKPPSRLQRHR